jgi:hypothetical protein
MINRKERKVKLLKAKEFICYETIKMAVGIKINSERLIQKQTELTHKANNLVGNLDLKPSIETFKDLNKSLLKIEKNINLKRRHIRDFIKQLKEMDLDLEANDGQ